MIWLHNNPHTTKRMAKPHSDAILQQLLQNALNTSAPIDILKNQHGKPFIDHPLCFSHANSRQLYAYVLHPTHEISIDLEHISPKRDVMRLAERHFHPSETEALQALSGTAQTRHFYQLWTHKEAWCKLEGGTLWQYMALAVADCPHQLYPLPNIRHFTGTVGSVKPLPALRINSIG